MNRISRFAMAAVAVGAVTTAGLALSADIAQADPFAAQPHSWCPGEALPFDNIRWDMGTVSYTHLTLPTKRIV